LLRPLGSASLAAAGSEGSMAATAGIGALAVHLASSLGPLADAVAALSCEALQAEACRGARAGSG